MPKLNLPCLKGQIGDWTYYSTVMRIKDVVHNDRIITVAESQELYTTNLSRILQREVDSSRISKIKRYLLQNNERFFSSIIVGIHGGSPEWSDLQVDRMFRLNDEIVDDNALSYIENKFGILTLDGHEQIFALDGQHRVSGLRKAYQDNPEIGNEEVSLVFVIHSPDNLERTRRLFTVLNKYAQKPKEAELIILDEDDAAAINSRKLAQSHSHLSIEGVIAESKSTNIATSDQTSLTTLVTINRINKTLYGRPKAFYESRPENSVINELHQFSVDFWDFIFDVFPELVQFIRNEENVTINDYAIKRNDINGGSLLLRPIGQMILARVYIHARAANSLDLLHANLRNVNLTLGGPNLKYIFWNDGKMLPKEAKLKEKLVFYILGFGDANYSIHDEIQRVYEAYNLTYDRSILPPN